MRSVSIHGVSVPPARLAVSLCRVPLALRGLESEPDGASGTAGAAPPPHTGALRRLAHQRRQGGLLIEGAVTPLLRC